ncbi:GAF domain-containing protein [Spirillospora sp. NPDC048911]|uniref:GAF domain-containing sensor histidine kinase n=1 Tax=Spirillospora sp. NPDC048911 TaxID=3364527 RepID=UPI0037144C91
MASGFGAGEDRARLLLPQLRLDDLLTELQTRLEAVRGTRDRVHALLEAVVSIGSELNLATVLRRIIEAATTLVDAQYGALGVISEEGEHLVEFITVGVSAEEIEAIGHWPHGHGILGLLIKEPQPLRLPDLSAHPESYGFPANHPPMHRFLGVPIRVRDEVFGNLYLTEKRGGAEFDEEDQIVVTALATAAGVAIENARLYEETRRREQWTEASAEISTALLSGAGQDQVLELVARRAREICGASHATVALVDDAAGEFELTAANGESADDLRGLRLPLDDDLLGRVLRSGNALSVPDASQTTMAAGMPDHVPLGPALLVPLGAGEGTRGVLAVGNVPEASPFSASVQQLLEAYTAQAAIALELAERRRDTERLAMLEDRDRIAKDLHDTVIQRLFATAMTLMSAIKLVEKRDVAVRLQRSVDDLDDTIRQIRSTIFALQAMPDDQSLRHRLHTVIDAATQSLGFAPSVRLDGLLDTSVGDTLGEHLLAVVTEALSNVARHARATSVAMSIEVGDAEVVLRVEDNGIGIPEDVGRRSGLANMADRADSLGGSFQTRPREGGGTLLQWRAPLDAEGN